MGAQEPTVVELRVHGVSGTPIEWVLDDPWPEQVAGDESGRIFRRRRPPPPARIVEGYHWGRYTAGSPSRALWLLLLPFTLVNVAGFALLTPATRRPLDRVADTLLRLLGLALTATMLISACYIGWDVLARQCVPQACSGEMWLLDWYADRSAGVRVIVAAVLPAAVLTLFWQFDRLAFEHDPPGPLVRPDPEVNGAINDTAFWRGAPHTAWQRAAHVWSGCALAGLLALAVLGDPRAWWDSGSVFSWACLVVAVLLAAALITGVAAVIVNPMPTGAAGTDGRDPVALPPWMPLVRLGATFASVAAVALTAIGLDHVVAAPVDAGAASTVLANGVFVLLAVLLTGFGVACAVIAFSRSAAELRQVPQPFRPFYFGLGGWMSAALGTTVGLGMSAAAVFWAARTLGEPVLYGEGGGIEIAAVYWIMAAIWGALAAALAVLLIPLVAWVLRRRGALALLPVVLVAITVAAVAVLTHPGPDVLAREAEWLMVAVALLAGACAVVFALDRNDFDALVTDDYANRADVARGSRRIARRWRIALIRYRYHHVLGVIATLGGLAAIIAGIGCAWLLADPDRTPGVLTAGMTGPLGQLGVVIVSFGATGLALLGLATWRRPTIRTAVGIVWDLLSFWPRASHPLCPPPYGGRAVLAVARRCSQLANGRVPDAPADLVVLSGHSQGSVITLGACAVLAGKRREPDGDDLGRQRAQDALARLHMLTYGSQLQFLYSRFFPAYFGFPMI
ncbi:MAG: hypothetical protein ABWY11_19375, partial [Umezawaea sp.]